MPQGRNEPPFIRQPGKALRLLLVALVLLVLAAHFLRAGNLALAALVSVVVALLFMRRPLAARFVQSTLILGAFEWLRTLAFLAGERRAIGAPYLRITLILGGVAFATVLSLLVFRSRIVKEHFRLL